MQKYFTNNYRTDLYSGLIFIDDNSKTHSLFKTHKVLKLLSYFGEFTLKQLKSPCFNNTNTSIISFSNFLDILLESDTRFTFELLNTYYKQKFVDSKKQTDINFIYYIFQAKKIEDVINAFDKKGFYFTLFDFRKLESTHCRSTSSCEMIYDKAV